MTDPVTGEYDCPEYFAEYKSICLAYKPKLVSPPKRPIVALYEQEGQQVCLCPSVAATFVFNLSNILGSEINSQDDLTMSNQDVADALESVDIDSESDIKAEL